MQYHLKNDHSDKPEICEICQAECISAFKLKRHILRQHGNRWKCRIRDCKHISKRKEYLKMHMRNHKNVDEKEKESYFDELKADPKKFLFI
jgi:hypothetical protein